MRPLQVLLVVMIVATFSKHTFHQHKVIRVPVNDRVHLDFLATLFYTNNTLDFWTEPKYLPSFVDVRVTPEQYIWFREELSLRGISYSVLIENVQELVDRQISTTKPDDFYSTYHTFEEVIVWLQGLPQKYPNLATLVSLGKSYQGRELLAVMVTSQKGPSNKPAVWFDGGIHAREWISVATSVYMLGNILNDYGNDTTITNLLDNLEIWVLPVFNPDGYAYTFTDDRMWRKTRSPNEGSDCIGTDPNRNWDYEWGGAGVSPDPCSESYLGPKAFSEIEVKTVALFIKNSGKFRGYINFHSYSQLWMSPWGYTEDLPKDYQIQNRLSERCVAAIKAVNNMDYGYGPIATTIYPASGSSADYTYGAANVVYSYGVELRDTGQYGFLLPEDQIVPSGVETYAAIKVWALQCLQST